MPTRGPWGGDYAASGIPVVGVHLQRRRMRDLEYKGLSEAAEDHSPEKGTLGRSPSGGISGGRGSTRFALGSGFGFPKRARQRRT